MQLDKKVCLVTGGTRGIGAATALTLAEQGASIALVARRRDETARETIKAVQALGHRCLLIEADVAQAGAAAQCVETTAAELGPIDVLVHSAGGPVPGGLMEITPEIWDAA